MILKILDIKPWCIKFDIDGQRYFIKQADHECKKTLYRFDLTDNKGHYKTKALGSKFGNLSLSDYISNPYKRGRTYKEIDLTQFWAQLACDGFGEILGMSRNDILAFANKRKIIRCEKKIAELEEALRAEKQKLDGYIAGRASYGS